MPFWKLEKQYRFHVWKADGIRDGKPYRKSYIGLDVYNKRGILYYVTSITKKWFSFLNFVSPVVCDIECTRIQTQWKIPRKFESKWVGGQVFGRWDHQDVRQYANC